MYGQNGELVTTKGDTLRGEIRFSNIEGNIDRLWYYPGEEKRRLFLATQIRSLEIDGVKYKVINYTGYRFMKVEKEGYLNVLKFRIEGSPSFSQPLLYKLDGKMMEVPILNFKKPMSAFLYECEGVATKIRNKIYEKKDLDTIINEYNSCIERRTAVNNTTASTISMVETSDTKEDAQNEVIPALQIIDQLRSIFKAQDGNSSDFDAIVKDVESKIKSGEAVPSYLINALKSSVDSNDELQNLIQQLERELN